MTPDNPHSFLLIQLNKSRDSDLVAQSSGTRTAKSRCSGRRRIVVHGIPRIPYGLCGFPGTDQSGLVKVFCGSAVRPGVFRAAASESLSWSVTSEPDGSYQEPSRPIRAHNLWPGDSSPTTQTEQISSSAWCPTPWEATCSNCDTSNGQRKTQHWKPT